MISRGSSWDRAPSVVDVHSHADVDEFIVIEGGEGYLLNGPDLESVTLTRSAARASSSCRPVPSTGSSGRMTSAADLDPGLRGSTGGRSRATTGSWDATTVVAVAGEAFEELAR